MRDLSAIQTRVDLTEMRFVTRSKGYGDRVRWYAARRALTRSMDCLGDSSPNGQVPSDHAIVNEISSLVPLTQRRALTGLTVSGSSRGPA